MGEENLAGGTSWTGNMQTRQGKEPGIKCQEGPRATQLVQSLLWEELFHLTGHSLGWGCRVATEQGPIPETHMHRGRENRMDNSLLSRSALVNLTQCKNITNELIYETVRDS